MTSPAKKKDTVAQARTAYNAIHTVPALSLSKASLTSDPIPPAAFLDAPFMRPMTEAELKRAEDADDLPFSALEVPFEAPWRGDPPPTIEQLNWPVLRAGLGPVGPRDFETFDAQQEARARVSGRHGYLRLYPMHPDIRSGNMKAGGGAVIREDVIPNSGVDEVEELRSAREREEQEEQQEQEDDFVREPTEVEQDEEDAQAEGDDEQDDEADQLFLRDFESFRPASKLPSKAYHRDAYRLSHKLATKFTPPGAEHRAFLLHGLLSPAECGYLIRAALPLLESLDSHFEQRYRVSDRAMLRSPAVADEIFKRILPHLKPEDYKNRVPLCFRQDGIWLPFGCNECLKVVRYSPGGHFSEHRDAPWIPSEDQCSIYTVIIYLNEEMRGGVTSLTTIADGPAGARYRTSDVVTEVMPTRGSALLFNHDLWHWGKPVFGGCKWIVRTELIFQRVASHYVDKYLHLDDKSFRECQALYDASLRKLREGDRRGFSETYQRVIAMQKEASDQTLLERTRSDRLLSPLNDDIISVVLEFLPDSDICGVMQISKATFYAVLQSPVWEFKTLARFPEAVAEVASIVLSGGVHSQKERAVIDWKRVYEQRCAVARRFCPMVLVLTDGGSVFAGINVDAPVNKQYADTHRTCDKVFRPEFAAYEGTRAAKFDVFQLPSHFSPFESDVVHLNLPITVRFEANVAVPAGCEALEQWFTVRRDGSVAWSVLAHGISELVAAIYVPMMICGPPQWWASDEEEEVIARLRAHQRDVFLLTRTPAVFIVHPAVCLIVAYNHERGKYLTASASSTASVSAVVCLRRTKGCWVALVETPSMRPIKTACFDDDEANGDSVSTLLDPVDDVYYFACPTRPLADDELAERPSFSNRRVPKPSPNFVKEPDETAALLVSGAALISLSSSFRDFCQFSP